MAENGAKLARLVAAIETARTKTHAARDIAGENGESAVVCVLASVESQLTTQIQILNARNGKGARP